MLLSSTALIRKTVLFLLAGLIVLLGIVATSVWLATQVEGFSTDVRRTREVVRSAREVLSLVQESETGQRGYILTGDIEYLERFAAVRARLDVERANLDRAMSAGTLARPALERVEQGIVEKFAELAETIDLVRAGRRDAVLEIVRSDRGKRIMDSLRSGLDAMISGAESRLATDNDNLRRSASAQTWVSGLGGIFVVLTAGMGFLIIVRYAREAIQARGNIEALNAGLEAQVAYRTSALALANDEIQRFAYIVSHDLRAPLVNIVGFTGELEAGAATLRRYIDGAEAGGPNAVPIAEARRIAHEDLPEAASFIRASTSKMDGLIKAILRLSRDGRRRLAPERIDLNAVITKSLRSLEHQLMDAKASVDISPGLGTITSDRVSLEQIFGNLIDNAIKYLDPGRPGRISISAQATPSEILITVTDNGRGIKPGDHERIFELFRRAGTQDQPGEGMGLTHVRALARRLGGDIALQSTLGEGACFQVRLLRSLPIDDARAVAA